MDIEGFTCGKTCPIGEAKLRHGGGDAGIVRLREEQGSRTSGSLPLQVSITVLLTVVLCFHCHVSTRFHPAVQRARAIIESGELGAIKHAEAKLYAPKGIMPDDDIRFNYDLGGGATMDMGCTCASSVSTCVCS